MNKHNNININNDINRWILVEHKNNTEIQAYIGIIKIWMRQLLKVNEFIIINNRYPCIIKDQDDISINKLARWCINQKSNYDIDYQKCKYIMRIYWIKEHWEEFISKNPY